MKASIQSDSTRLLWAKCLKSLPGQWTERLSPQSNISHGPKFKEWVKAQRCESFSTTIYPRPNILI